MEKKNLTSNAVKTYIDTIINKLTNSTPTIYDDGSTAVASERSYLFGSPSLLLKYLEQFAINNTFRANSIVDGPSTSICKDSGGRT
jgi:hypothetical protein